MYICTIDFATLKLLSQFASVKSRQTKPCNAVSKKLYFFLAQGELLLETAKKLKNVCLVSISCKTFPFPKRRQMEGKLIII